MASNNILNTDYNIIEVTVEADNENCIEEIIVEAKNENSGFEIIVPRDCNEAEVEPPVNDINIVNARISDNTFNNAENTNDEDIINAVTPRIWKKRANPSIWKANMRHTKRMKGQSYVNCKGHEIPDKKNRSMENCNCSYNCVKKIDESQQIRLFNDYYSLGDTARQKSYFSGLIVEKDTIRRRPQKNIALKAKKSHFYYLPDANGERQRVCLKFFLFVFQIFFRVTDSVLKKQSPTGVFVDFEHGLSGVKPVNATSPDIIKCVKAHIDLFPRMPSHYCCKNSRKHYLAPDLNVSKMYQLYKESHEEGEVTVSEWVYCKIFNEYDPLLSTYKPKKDQCTKCNEYKGAENKELLEESYRAHKECEALSLKLKRCDLEACDPAHKVITFDLEAILLLPFAGDAQIYYRQKLNLYNFTIFDDKKNGLCFLWDETHGNKGCCEIASCIFLYLKSLPLTVTSVTIWSDTCVGQNRNQLLAAAIIYAINTIPNLQCVDMKYMESGHSYLECDSMHSRIENNKKHKRIFNPTEMRMVIETARKIPRPYKVNMMNFTDFYYFKQVAKQIVANCKYNEQGAAIQWLHIKYLHFEKGSDFVQYKYDYKEPYFL